jgi:hypothetical protein
MVHLPGLAGSAPDKGIFALYPKHQSTQIHPPSPLDFLSILLLALQYLAPTAWTIEIRLAKSAAE